MAQSHTSAPVYKPLKTRSAIAGIGASEFGKILLMLAIGAGAFFGTGLWRHAAQVPLTQSEALAELTELTAIQETTTKVRDLITSTGAASVSEIDLTERDAERYQRAVALGITPSTSRDELLAMVPTSKEEILPVVSDPVRGIVLIAIPLFVFVAGHLEYSHGSCIAKDLKRMLRNARSQHVYLSQPKKYVKEQNGVL